MFERYVELAINVEPLRGDTYPLSVKGPGGDGRGLLRLPTSDPLYQQLAARLMALDTDEDVLSRIGQILFQSIFSNPAIMSVYARTQGTLKPNEGLRITFSIGEDEVEVAALPWEFLFDPDQIGPMAALDAPIVRYLPQSSVLPRLEAQLPLKVLLTGAETEPKPDVARALADAEAALAGLRDSIAVTVEPHLTRQKFQRLLRGNHHIWHFVGHGTPAGEAKSGALLFEDDQGEAERVSARDLGILLNRNSIRLIVLNACDTAKLSVDPFRSVAPALLRAQIPGVIAMQLRVSQDSARAFSEEFYRALADGYPLDACVTEGRKAVIGSAGLRNPDWGIPVVYSRAESGRLFERPAASPAPPITVPTAPPTSGVNISIGDNNRIEGSNIVIDKVGNNTTSGSTFGDQATPSFDDGLDEQIVALESRVATLSRVINVLKDKQAKMSVMVDSMTVIELEDNEQARIAAMEQLIALRSERVKQLERAPGGSNAALLADARQALLSDKIRRDTMELRLLEQKTISFGGRRTPYDQQIAALKSQIAELKRQYETPGAQPPA